MKLAMCVGTNRHYRISEIHIRHFIQSGQAASCRIP
jgi:serine/threonine-protein kinase HipA